VLSKKKVLEMTRKNEMSVLSGQSRRFSPDSRWIPQKSAFVNQTLIKVALGIFHSVRAILLFYKASGVQTCW
jgi:hypothetical protein